MRTRSQGDSYRPSERPSERPIDRGRDSYDSYHPAPPSPRDRDDMRSRADRYHQDQDDRSSMYRFGSSDSYRPEPSGNSSSVRPREEFSFRSAQAPPQDYPIHDGSAPQRARRRRNPNRQNADWQKYVKVAPHERALFQPRGTTPERMVGMNEGPTKFLAFDDLSDSRSDDMSLESASEEGEAPTQKKSRTAAQVEDDGASVPKWSNPDPFIVLPAEDPLKKKKKDIVQLIRKAKITAAEAAATTNAVADNDDFISLDDDETPPQAIPTGPSSFSHRNQLHPERTSNAPGSSFVAPGSAFTPINASSLGPPPGLGLTSESIPLPPPPPSNPPPPNPPPPPPLVGSLDQVGSMGSGNVWPPPSVEAAVGGGSNTRSHEPSQATRSNKRKRSPTELGDIIPEWVSDAPVGTRAPWTVEDHSRTENMGHWLSKDINDFYNFVKPHDFEKKIRRQLYERIEDCLIQSQNLPRGRLHCFGSYAAGLYLPTADMDLVYISDYHLNGGRASIDPKQSNFLWRIESVFRRANLADRYEVIRKAKVPLIKFVDRETGLKVDISFEKVDGLTTQRYFEKWKSEFPIMPALVTLVKQFLLMRGLSEVRDGGLGGFSVICLVVHMLYLMPGTQSKNLVPEEHLGQLFLEFLELYGKKFDLASTMISMSPPKYLRKERWGPDGRQMKPDKLTIIDPSRPDNDISGGSSRAKFIFGLFARAHDNLLDRMADLLINRPSFGNVLDAVFKGNYSIYLEQRAHLRAIHDAAVSYRPPPTQDSQSQGISIKGRSRGGGGNSNTSNGSSNAGRGRSDAGRGKQSRGRGRSAGRPEKRQRT